MKNLFAILISPIAFYAGIIGMFGCYISYPLLILFNPRYKLPDDKAGIDVAPVTKYFWRFYENWCRRNLTTNYDKIPFVEFFSLIFTLLVSVFVILVVFPILIS